MNETSDAKIERVFGVTEKRLPRKPEGYIENPEERRRLVDELEGSMPDLPSVEEFLRRRRQGL